MTMSVESTLYVRLLTAGHTQQCLRLSRQQSAEFYAQPWNLPFPWNFEHFHRILYWPVIRGQIWHIFVWFRRPSKLFSTCRHDCAVKYMTATQALMEGILKILNVSEILPVYLFYLSVAVIDNKCCIFGPNWSRLGGR